MRNPHELIEHSFCNCYLGTEEYVICFEKDVPEAIKERFIDDYADYYTKAKASGECCH